jgi:UDP-glucose:(heptosyl)LPS alpha-1,3-glucosyltransferase
MIKKVAIIIERTDVSLGGAERSMFEVANALASLGLQVDVLAAKGQPTAANVHILCADVPEKRVSLLVFAEALRRRVPGAAYDILHSVLPFAGVDLYQPRGGTYAESAERNAASYPNPLARRWKRMTAFANRRRAKLLRAEFRCCHGSKGPIISALSRYVVEQLRQHYGTDPNRIVRMLNGVDTDRRADASAAKDFRSQALARLGAWGQQDPVLFLFAANNFRLKGLRPLIQALQLAARTGTERPPCLVIAGAGKGDAYRRLARRLGVEDRILFLGPVPDIGNILSAIDVGVLPTFYDPSSRFILEALVAGKPVITTQFNGAIDHFTDGRHGKVIDSPENIPALADAIRCYTSTDSIDKASQAIAADNLRANLSVRRVAKELLCVYEAIVKSRKRSA